MTYTTPLPCNPESVCRFVNDQLTMPGVQLQQCHLQLTAQQPRVQLL